METYSLLREFADSWVLLALTVFFVGVVVWVFRPGARALQEEAANSIFRNDKKPAREMASEGSGMTEGRTIRSTSKEPSK